MVKLFSVTKTGASGLGSTFRFWLGFICLLSFWACESKKTSAPASSAFRTVTDDLGRTVNLPVLPKRVMALTPSLTEMLFAVADTASIIARTQNCDFPAAALTKPVLNNYPMDYERLLALKPDVVFATDGIISMEVAAQVQKLGIPIYFQTYDSVADIIRGIRSLGVLLHRETQANAVADSLQTQLNQLAADTAGPNRPRVLAITWQDPIYVYGRNTVFSDKLRYAGGQNAVTEVFAQPYPALTREYILKMNPEVIIGSDFAKMEKTFFSLYPELRRIKAYQNKRIYQVTDDLMSRPSPRVVEGIAELKAVLR
ncbi:ABC transporter substrate-binding protein [Rufibacter sediminis]|uniref:ABC transporter substrate-binding protein n=1 Tax=Rufibacter sediminis TaxID=2762756 RepID=A0ABR6VWH5_9BACT|nr:helical backbone metal receptor [Rufibacter sediminis]MBC3541532.1 ABC transporter substrate-binding protein [Rufibacter sediminis]